MDWIAFLQVGGPVALGLAGIGGTVWGVRHQSKSQALEALRAEQRTTYADMLVAAYAAAEQLPEFQFEEQLGWRKPFDMEAFEALQQEAARLAGRCALLGDDNVRYSAQSLVQQLAQARRAMTLSKALLSGGEDRANVEQAADLFREFAQADLNQTSRTLHGRLRSLRHWWADRHERRAHKNLEPGPTADEANALEAAERADPQD